MKKKGKAMQEEIGTTAGAIWDALNAKGELSVAQLTKDVKGRPPLLDWAIGWLAREGKIVRCMGRISSTLSEPQRMGSKTPKNQIRLRATLPAPPRRASLTLYPSAEDV